MRILDKIQEIEDYLSELSIIAPHEFEEYEKDIKTKAACERFFEKIIGAVVDLAFLVIRDKGYKTPEEDKEAFDILEKEEIIGQELAGRLKDAKGMRNIIAHEYGKVDDHIVFESITTELVADTKNLIKLVRQLLN